MSRFNEAGRRVEGRHALRTYPRRFQHKTQLKPGIGLGRAGYRWPYDIIVIEAPDENDVALCEYVLNPFPEGGAE